MTDVPPNPELDQAAWLNQLAGDGLPSKSISTSHGMGKFV